MNKSTINAIAGVAVVLLGTVYILTPGPSLPKSAEVSMSSQYQISDAYILRQIEANSREVRYDIRDAVVKINGAIFILVGLAGVMSLRAVLLSEASPKPAQAPAPAPQQTRAVPTPEAPRPMPRAVQAVKAS